MQSGKCSILSVFFAAFIVIMVALIVAPLMPPHEYARKSICQSNLKQCAQALKMYSDDYDGRLPSSYLISRAKRWNAPDFLTFATKLGEYPAKPTRKHGIWQVLYDNIRNKDVMWCPSDTVDHADQHARTSYWYKLANDKAWYGIGCEAPRRSMGDYQFESDQIAFYEHVGWHFGDTSGMLKNGVQINAAFMDTHIETIVIRNNATSGDPINCAANSDGEPMYYNLDTRANKQDIGPAKHTDPTLYSDSL